MELMTDRKTVKILNIGLNNITSKELLNDLHDGILYTPNIDHFVVAQKDRIFYDAYRNADFVVLDSQVIFLLSKITGPAFREKISGADFFPRYCQFHKDDPNVNIFVLGGLDDVSSIVQQRINVEAGRKMVVGAYSPKMGFEKDQEEIEKAIEMINASAANVLAVGLGTPKQEKWIHQYKHRLTNVRVFMGIGATLDFIAGKQKRAPKLFQKSGMEWLFRLLGNPRRFAKRYLITDIVFIYYFVLDLINVYRDPFQE